MRFADGLRALLDEEVRLPLEVGPGRALATFCRQAPAAAERLAPVSTLPGDGDELRDLLAAAGSLWVRGVDLDWERFHEDGPRGRVPLPTYPSSGHAAGFDAPAVTEAAGEPAARSESATLDRMFYVPRWEPQEPAASTAAAGPALVVLDEGGAGRRFADALGRTGRVVHTARPGPGFEDPAADGGDFVVPLQRDGFLSLLDALERRTAIPRVIYYFAGLGDGDRMDEALAPEFFGLLGLAQALGAGGRQDPLAIVAVTSGLFAVTGEEMLRTPAQALLLGPCHVIPQEYPHVACRLVDLGSLADEAWMAGLAAEAVAPGSEVVVAHRDGRRFVRTFEAATLPTETSEGARLRPGGVYLITGGLGGVGLAIARHLARTVGARLLLTGRAAVPPRESWEA